MVRGGTERRFFRGLHSENARNFETTPRFKLAARRAILIWPRKHLEANSGEIGPVGEGVEKLRMALANRETIWKVTE
jgi:hypothetical protein